MPVSQEDPKLYNAYTTLKMREVNRRRKQQAVEYKGGCCEVCGYSKCLGALEFHHRNPNQKDFRVSNRKFSWKRVWRELAKCSLLCANCHREEHEKLKNKEHEKLWKEVRKDIPERKPEGKTTKPCEQCGETFESYVNTGQRFCSRQCKGLHQSRVVWPSDRDLSRMLKQTSVSQVARTLGVVPKTVRERCQKRGIER